MQLLFSYLTALLSNAATQRYLLKIKAEGEDYIIIYTFLLVTYPILEGDLICKLNWNKLLV